MAKRGLVDPLGTAAPVASPDGSEDIFAEMRPLMVDVPEVDEV